MRKSTSESGAAVQAESSGDAPCDNWIFALHFTLSGRIGGRPKSSSTSAPGRSGAAVAAPSTPTDESTMRGQFAGVARNCWSCCGCALGMRDRVVSVSAVAARTQATKRRERGILASWFAAREGPVVTTAMDNR